jgi:hypothetical protein
MPNQIKTQHITPEPDRINIRTPYLSFSGVLVHIQASTTAKRLDRRPYLYFSVS